MGQHLGEVSIYLDSLCSTLVHAQVSPLIGDNFSMAGCMGMMIIDSILYGILMWYIEATMPGGPTTIDRWTDSYFVFLFIMYPLLSSS